MRAHDDTRHPADIAREVSTRRGVPVGIVGLSMIVYAMATNNDIMIYSGAAMIALATKMVTFRQLSSLVPWAKKEPEKEKPERRRDVVE